MPAKIRSLKELLALQPPVTKYLIEPEILSVGGSMVIYGEAETWKSWLTIDMAFALAHGKNWLVFPTKKSRVLIIQSEQTEFMYRDRILSWTASHNTWTPESEVFFRSEVDFKLDLPLSWGLLRGELELLRPDVMVLDNLRRCISGAISEDSVKRITDLIARSQSHFNTAWVIVHHTRKEKEDGEDKGPQEMAGSAVLRDWADTILKSVPYLRGSSSDVIDLVFQKNRNSVKMRPPDLRVTALRAGPTFTII